MRDHCLLLRNHHPRCAARGNTYTHNMQSRFGRIHAPSSPNKCIHPRSTHTHLESEYENDSSDNINHFQRRYSRQSRTCMPQPTARCVYVRSSNLCVPLLPGNQHTERLHDFVHEGQRIWVPVDMGLLVNAVRSRCNTCRQSLWRLQLSATTSPDLEGNQRILRPLE